MEYDNLNLSLNLERLIETNVDKYESSTILFNSLNEIGNKYELTPAELYRSANTKGRARLNLNVFYNEAKNKMTNSDTFNDAVDKVWDKIKDDIKNIAININNFLSQLDISDNKDEVLDTVRAKPKLNRNR